MRVEVPCHAASFTHVPNYKVQSRAGGSACRWDGFLHTRVRGRSASRLVNLVRMLVAQCILQVGKIRRWFDAHGLDTLPEWQENTLTPDLEGMQPPRLIVSGADTPM